MKNSISMQEKDLKEKCSIDNLDRFTHNFWKYLIKKYLHLYERMKVFINRPLSNDKIIEVMRNGKRICSVGITCMEERLKYCITTDDDLKLYSSYKSVVKLLDKYLAE